jgi:inositol-pentakisphosphate 2-kinase
MMGSPIEDLSEADLRTRFVASLVDLLEKTPVLRMLDSLQRSLDCLDIEGISALLQQEQQSSHKTSQEDLADPTLHEWAQFIDKFSTSSPTSPLSIPDDLTRATVRDYLMAYLLSCTFKDCSIIVRTNLLGHDQHKAFPEFDPSHVSLIDLDVKRMDRMKRWGKLDTEIVDVYLQVEEKDRKLCTDERRK